MPSKGRDKWSSPGPKRQGEDLRGKSAAKDAGDGVAGLGPLLLAERKGIRQPWGGVWRQRVRPELRQDDLCLRVEAHAADACTQKDVRERHRGWLQKAVAMAPDVLQNVLLLWRGLGRRRVQEEAHFLPQHAFDDQVVVQTKPHSLLVEGFLVVRGMRAHGAHLLHETRANAAILKIEPESTGFTIEQLRIHDVLNQPLHLGLGRWDAPLLRKVCLQLAELLRGDDDGGALAPRRPRPIALLPHLTPHEQEPTEEHKVE